MKPWISCGNNLLDTWLRHGIPPEQITTVIGRSPLSGDYFKIFHQWHKRQERTQKLQRILKNNEQ